MDYMASQAEGILCYPIFDLDDSTECVQPLLTAGFPALPQVLHPGDPEIGR